MFTVKLNSVGETLFCFIHSLATPCCSLKRKHNISVIIKYLNQSSIPRSGNREVIFEPTRKSISLLRRWEFSCHFVIVLVGFCTRCGVRLASVISSLGQRPFFERYKAKNVSGLVLDT